MATNSAKEKWDAFSSAQVDEDQEEEEEALSLCDLPVNLIKEEEHSRKEDAQVIETQEDFDFHSWDGPEAKMCAADEVFFGGQILPLRLSVSSCGGLITTGFQDKLSPNLSRCESMDHGSLSTASTINTSRSSSIRSQYSSSSTSTSSTTRISKPRVRNQFHTYPSPKPQIRVPSLRQASVGNNISRKSSSAWEFFRLGVVPAPEIGLQDLKIRSTNNSSASKNCVSRNSSTSSSSNSGSFKANSTAKMGNNHGLKQFLGKSSSGFLGGCKCSIETVPSNIVIIKNNAKSSANIIESETHAIKEKVLQLRKQNQKEKKQGKQAMSHRRTFEWLKELSHASNPYEALITS
ncbi:Membrane-associated kinase regulator protein [Quillaja saponaria]|uniref:Membrane-associated kinase regulator protein n=1 Tax=Quillaja saponaria TaxID=32244 RepID=A0AAD7L7X9_QUISA|nr:Membrane-associated kinase regulator protein [Quillaja saponaria]